MTTTEYWTEFFSIIYLFAGIADLLLFIPVFSCTIVNWMEGDKLNKKIKCLWLIIAILSLFLLFLFPFPKKL